MEHNTFQDGSKGATTPSPIRGSCLYPTFNSFNQLVFNVEQTHGLTRSLCTRSIIRLLFGLLSVLSLWNADMFSPSSKWTRERRGYLTFRIGMCHPRNEMPTQIYTKILKIYAQNYTKILTSNQTSPRKMKIDENKSAFFKKMIPIFEKSIPTNFQKIKTHVYTKSWKNDSFLAARPQYPSRLTFTNYWGLT